MMLGNAYVRQNDIAVSGPPDHDFVLSGELSCLPAIRCGLPGDDEQDTLPTARGTVVDTDKVAVMQLAGIYRNTVNFQAVCAWTLSVNSPVLYVPVTVPADKTSMDRRYNIGFENKIVRVASSELQFLPAPVQLNCLRTSVAVKHRNCQFPRLL